MLKSYLLAMIREPAKIESANHLWRGRVAALSDVVDKGDSDYIRNWLRSKYAETIRERGRTQFLAISTSSARRPTSGFVITATTSACVEAG